MPSSVSIYSAYSTINVGSQIRLSKNFEPSRVKDDFVDWHSSDESIATVDKNGIVTGKNKGKVTISATTTNGHKDTIDLEIKEAQVISRSVESSNYGQNQQSGITYILNTKSKKFHYSHCSFLPTKNRSDTTASRDEIISWGYEPCQKCKP